MDEAAQVQLRSFRARHPCTQKVLLSILIHYSMEMQVCTPQNVF